VYNSGVEPSCLVISELVSYIKGICEELKVKGKASILNEMASYSNESDHNTLTLRNIRALSNSMKFEGSMSCSLEHLLSHMNPIHTLTPYFSKIHVIVSSHLCIDLPSGLFPYEFSEQNCFVFFTSSLIAMCSALSNP